PRPAPAHAAGRAARRPGREPHVTDTAPHAPAAIALDLVLGERPPAACAVCGKHLPALTEPRFELEDADAGQPLCMLCTDRTHRGLRCAILLLNQCLELQAAGQTQQAREALAAVVDGMERALEDAPEPRYQRPIRRQPRSSTRQARRRS